jgi:hypothetical protein
MADLQALLRQSADIMAGVRAHCCACGVWHALRCDAALRASRCAPRCAPRVAHASPRVVRLAAAHAALLHTHTRRRDLTRCAAQLDPQQYPPIARDAAQVAELSRALKERTPRLDAAAAANQGVRMLARRGLDADTLTRNLRTIELRTTCVSRCTHHPICDALTNALYLPIYPIAMSPHSWPRQPRWRSTSPM